MISISFYLLNPKSKSQSQVYVSISNKKNRLRFATGQGFLTSCCNKRLKKGEGDLAKKGTKFFLQYRCKLEEIRDTLLEIEMSIKGNQEGTLEYIRDSYYSSIGKLKETNQISFFEVYDQFFSSNQSGWGDGTQDHFITLKNHLKSFEESHGELKLNNINETFWSDFRDNYLVKKGLINSSSNKNLKKLKQFLRYAIKKDFITHKLDLKDLSYLDHLESFKIALKLEEVETLIKLDLSNSVRLEQVRDLFLVEIYSGQRYSDVEKTLDVRHIAGSNIHIHQTKGGKKVSIPVYEKLDLHFSYIAKKYPNGLPIISNQNFNIYIKEVCEIAKFNRVHAWESITGKKKTKHKDFRYNLISSHTGRRTFCTIALKSGILPMYIMKVTGHKTMAQFLEYVKVDDEDMEHAFDQLFESEKTKAKKALV